MLRLNYQNDVRWQHDVMTDLPYKNGSTQTSHDTIGDLGCAVTSFANLIQITHGIDYTPGTLNTWLRNHEGYAALANPSGCTIGQESFMLWHVVCNQFDIIDHGNVDVLEYKHSFHYICRFMHKGYGHYSNVLKELCINGKQHFLIFNVWNGETEIIAGKDITFLKKFDG
jgi:hypothetical protein